MLEGVRFRAFELVNCHYKKVPRNLTNCGRLCIISCWWGLEVLPFEVLPHKLPHTQRHTPHTQPRQRFYIIHIETMTNTQDTRETLEAFFSPFIKKVNGLTHVYANHEKATARRFEFSYSFDTQYWTGKPLFSLYFTHSKNRVQRTTREAEQFEQFESYCNALRDVASALYS